MMASQTESASVNEPTASTVKPNPTSVPKKKKVAKNAPGNRSDPAWNYGTAVDGNNRVIKCRFCSHVIRGSIYRLKHHLAKTNKDVRPCNSVTEEVAIEMENQCNGIHVALINKTESQEAGQSCEDGKGKRVTRAAPSDNSQLYKRRCTQQTTINTHYKKCYKDAAKLVASRDERALIDRQTKAFKKRTGLFGCEMARTNQSLMEPADWWDSYGIEYPELQTFAIRILSLTCSSSGCERNWSAFEMVHTKRRNRLKTKTMNDVVFVMVNSRLAKKKKERKAREFADLVSDSEWVSGDENEIEDGNTNSIDVDENTDEEYGNPDFNRMEAEQCPIYEEIKGSEDEGSEAESDEDIGGEKGDGSGGDGVANENEDPKENECDSEDEEFVVNMNLYD